MIFYNYKNILNINILYLIKLLNILNLNFIILKNIFFPINYEKSKIYWFLYITWIKFQQSIHITNNRMSL